LPTPFITTTDLVNYLGRGNISDPGIVIAADSACDTVRTLSELTVNLVTADRITVDGTGTDAILLPDVPSSGLASYTLTAGSVTVAGGTVTDWVLADDGRLIRRADATGAYSTTVLWPAGRQNVSVTYDHGWADANIPRDLRMVALALADRFVVQGPAAEEAIGDSRMRYSVASTDLTENEMRIINKYKPER
jgi:hypothetical protein